MLILLSPAKRLDEETRPPTRKHTEPRLLAESAELIRVLRHKSVDEIAGLFGISDELAALNVQRYAAWEPPFTLRNAKQALFTFAGDVYQGMQPRGFDGYDLAHAQKTIRILSGLYGLLRPLDLIQPYRLEMGIPLPTVRGKNLYEFWGTELTELLRDDLSAAPGTEVVIDLASAEYFGAIDPVLLDVPVVSPRFEDQGPRGNYAVISFSAKKARGDMAGWLVRNRVRSARPLKDYDGLGYRYVKELSTPAVPVFRRPRSQTAG